MALALGQAATTAPTLVHRQVTSTATVLLALLTSPRHALGTDTHSAGALVRLMLGATAAVVHTKDPLTVYGIVPRTDARDLARTRFAPLDQAGAPGAPVLLDTLRTWLTLHGSWDRTAAACTSTATPCATVWHGSANSSTSTCTTPAYAWNSGSPCTGCPARPTRPTSKAPVP